MEVVWLVDGVTVLGGAELATEELERRKPDNVMIRRAGPDPKLGISPTWNSPDVVVAHNISEFTATIIPWLEYQKAAGRRIIKYVHDLWIHGDPDVREWFLENAELIFTSNLHRNQFEGISKPVTLIPPPVNLTACEAARGVGRGRRVEGNVFLGRLYEGKGIFNLIRYARKHEEEIDVYGHGPDTRFLAQEDLINYKGKIAPKEVPYMLTLYKNFIFLPDWPEPCGRAVVEAWACGCNLVLNENVGAKEWIDSEPEGLRTAADDFWHFVTS